MRARRQHTAAATGILAAILSAAASPTRADIVALDATRDNTLCEDPTGALSNGAGAYLFAGRTDDGKRRRTLIQFDIAAALPAGATVNSVQLTLHMSRTKAAAIPITLHRMTAAWGEADSDASREEGGCAAAVAGDATWTHAFLGGPTWTALGGDRIPAASATASVADIGDYTWGLTPEMVADAQAWLDAPAGNFGWMLAGSETGTRTAKRFDSRQNADATVRPMLTIDYTPGGSTAPTIYESLSPMGIVVPGNAIGSGPSPFDHLLLSDPMVYYQVDDGAGLPATIFMVPTATGLRIRW